MTKRTPATGGSVARAVRSKASNSCDPSPTTPTVQHHVPSGTPTDLYRHFDVDGRLLYVGISLHALARTRQHKGQASWWSAAATMTVERFSTRREALIAERKAIRKEKPLYNKAHATRRAARPSVVMQATRNITGANTHAEKRLLLNDLIIKNLKPKKRPYYLVWDSEQRGLAVRVGPTGNRSFICICACRGRTRWYSIGPADVIGIADARLRANKILAAVLGQRLDRNLQKLERSAEVKLTPPKLIEVSKKPFEKAVSANPMIFKREVMARIPLSYVTIWKLMHAGQFPRPYDIGGKNAWLASEIEDWIISRPITCLKGDPVETVGAAS